MNEYIVELKMPSTFENHKDRFKELITEFLNRPNLQFERFNSIESRDSEFKLINSPVRLCTIGLVNTLPTMVVRIEICDTEQFQCFIKILTPETLNDKGFFYPRCLKMPNGEPAKILAIDYIENRGDN